MRGHDGTQGTSWSSHPVRFKPLLRVRSEGVQRSCLDCREDLFRNGLALELQLLTRYSSLGSHALVSSCCFSYLSAKLKYRGPFPARPAPASLSCGFTGPVNWLSCYCKYHVPDSIVGQVSPAPPLVRSEDSKEKGTERAIDRTIHTIAEGVCRKGTRRFHLSAVLVHTFTKEVFHSPVPWFSPGPCAGRRVPTRTFIRSGSSVRK